MDSTLEKMAPHALVRQGKALFTASADAFQMPRDMQISQKVNCRDALKILSGQGINLRHKKETPEESSVLYQIENEYEKRDAVKPFGVLRSVIVEYPVYGKQGRTTSKVNFDEKIEKNIKHLAATRDLEFGTERTKVLDDVASKMIAGTDVESVRVVIMRKGEEHEAFVMPDGTIFISQSIINMANSLDELGGVLSHEINHLINKTWHRRALADSEIENFAIGWVHEMASDVFEPHLLEKAGLNSISGSTFIDRLSNNARGTVHQSGLARATEAIGTHFAIDFATSSTGETSIQNLKTETVRKTNLEILKYLIENKGDKIVMKKLMQSLHPKDLRSAYKMINDIADDHLDYRKIRQPFRKSISKAFDIYFEVVGERLQSLGATESEIRLFYYSFTEFDSSYDYQPQLFRQQSQENLQQMAEAIPDYCKSGKHKMYEEAIYGEFSNKYYLYPLMSDLSMMEFVQKGLSTVDGMPMSGDTLISFVKGISQVDPNQYPSHNMDGTLSKIILGYVDSVILATTGAEEVDADQIRNLFIEIKDLDVPLNLGAINAYIHEDKSVYTQFGNKQVNTKISLANQETVHKIFREVFSEEIGEIIQEMDMAVKAWSERRKYYSHGEQSDYDYSSFIKKIRDYFVANRMTDAERVVVIEELSRKIAATDFSAKFDVFADLDDRNKRSSWDTIRPELTPEVQERNNQLIRFNLQFHAGLGLFKSDGPEFYQFMNRIMQESGLDLEPYSQAKLYRLLAASINDANTGERLSFGNLDKKTIIDDIGFEQFYYQNVRIHDLDKFNQLPFVVKLLEKNDLPVSSNLRELVENTENLINSFGLAAQDSKRRDLYSDDLEVVIAAKNVREEFEKLLTQGINEADYKYLYQYIERYFPDGIHRNRLLQSLAGRILSLNDLSLDEKTEFLFSHFDDLGMEGAVVVAEQIDTLTDFRKFKDRLDDKFQQYLDGGTAMTMVAGADIVTSFFADEFVSLLNTSRDDVAMKAKTSTQFAKDWFKTVMGSTTTTRSQNVASDFDPENKKFTISRATRDHFKTVTDLFSELQGYSPTVRAMMVHKALTEQNGAFSTPENRKKLSQAMLQALSLPRGFISDTLHQLVMDGDPKWLDFPTARMLGPLLFRSLDTDSIDIGKVASAEVWHFEDKDKSGTQKLGESMADSEIRHIIETPTRDVVVFGKLYQEYPNSRFSELAQRSDASYRRSLEQLNHYFESSVEADQDQVDFRLRPNDEAIVQGVEAIGAMGVRSLQLARQLYPFSPEVSARLSRCFDANPGLNKLLFWTNLDKFANNGDPTLRDFIQNQVVSIGKKLGAGSLFTTYAATAVGTDGGTQNIVLKMLNPNAAAIVTQTGRTAEDVLTTVSQQNSGKDRELARIGLSLVGLTQQWCLKDINDPNFSTDDDLFRQTIERYNQVSGTDLLYAPDRVYDSMKLKVETEGAGITLNKLLSDESIDQETKKMLVENLWKFFRFQMEKPVIGENGNEMFLCHADPHVGNFIVDLRDEPRVGILDRSMYLRLKREDVEVVSALISGKNTQFIDLLIQRSLDVNKIINTNERKKIQNNIRFSLVKEAARQKVMGKSDELALLQVVLSKLALYHADVPLELQLMIRNVAAFEELRANYQVT